MSHHGNDIHSESKLEAIMEEESQMTIKSCNCIDWNNTVKDRNAMQKNGALSVGFMMDDPVRPYMQHEATGEISFCPWCGQSLNDNEAELWRLIDEATK